jgi:hypothetical protein
MAVWGSSSLSFSDHNFPRHSSGLMKNTSTRISKQHLTEHKMFGSKRGKTGKDFKIGKKFRGPSKGGLKKGFSGGHGVSMKSKGISPSIEEFDKMMANMSGGGKKGFSRKMFG